MSPLSDAAKALFDWDENSPHAPLATEVEGTNFRTPCRCGYEGRAVASSPSHSYNSTKVHVTNENRREEGGGEKVKPEDYTRTGEPPRAVRRVSAPSRASVGSPRPSRTGPATPCGCGCGESSGGLFRPGHDSKLLSRLMGEIRAGTKTLAEAHAEMTAIGTSEVLREKLTKKVS